MAKRPPEGDQTIIRYLLNELSAEDQARFEEAYLGDGSLFEQVRALEEELIEDYVKGELSGRERRRFERHYLASDQRRARIEAARELVRVCSPKAQAAVGGHVEGKFFPLSSRLRSLVKPRLAPAFGVAALLSLVAAGLVIELLRLRGQLAAVGEERAAAERRAEESERRLAREIERLVEERNQGAELKGRLENLYGQLDRLERELAEPKTLKNQIAFLALTPGVRSVDRQGRAVISDHTSFVELQVELEEQESTNPRPYRAVVKIAHEGREIWARDGIKPRRRKSAWYVVVRAPANRFRTAGAQDFILTLSAPAAGGKDYEELESYYFQVTANRH